MLIPIPEDWVGVDSCFVVLGTRLVRVVVGTGLVVLVVVGTGVVVLDVVGTELVVLVVVGIGVVVLVVVGIGVVVLVVVGIGVVVLVVVGMGVVVVVGSWVVVVVDIPGFAEVEDSVVVALGAAELLGSENSVTEITKLMSKSDAPHLIPSIFHTISNKSSLLRRTHVLALYVSRTENIRFHARPHGCNGSLTTCRSVFAGQFRIDHWHKSQHTNTQYNPAVVDRNTMDPYYIKLGILLVHSFYVAFVDAEAHQSYPEIVAVCQFPDGIFVLLAYLLRHC